MTTIVVDGSLSAPLDRARILWNSAIKSGSPSNSFPGSNPAGALNPQTFDRVRVSGTVTGTIIQVATGSKAIDCVAFAHRGLEGRTIRVTTSQWSETFTVQSKAPVMVIGHEHLTTTVQVQIVSATPNPEIAYLSAGLALAMERPIYGGHSPITLSRVTRGTPNISQGGEFLGRSIERRAVATSYAWRNLSAAWYRVNFDPFVAHCADTLGTFFISWRPSSHPNETAYAWLTGDVQPNNSGSRDLMDVTVRAVGDMPR